MDADGRGARKTVERLLLRPEEAGEVLGFSRSKTYQLLADGTLPTVKIGRSTRIPVEALREWVRSQAVREVLPPVVKAPAEARL